MSEQPPPFALPPNYKWIYSYGLDGIEWMAVREKPTYYHHHLVTPTDTYKDVAKRAWNKHKSEQKVTNV